MTCVELRRGDGDGETLFVLTGAGGSADELAPLADAMRGRRVVAVVPFAPQRNGDAPPATIGEIAATAAALVRRHQAHGPYRLLGYSFGGLVALETAELLRAGGDDVAFVGLIDAIYDRRFWPFELFARATLRRTGGHLRGLSRRPPGEAWSELRERSRRLVTRLTERASPGAASPTIDHGSELENANFAAMGGWQPRRFDLPVVLFSSGGADDWGCEPARLWERYLPDLQVRRIPGSHADLVRVPAVTAALARAVDDAVDSADAPPLRVLLAATFGWEASGRLAVELAAAGCVVSAVAPRTQRAARPLGGHPELQARPRPAARQPPARHRGRRPRPRHPLRRPHPPGAAPGLRARRPGDPRGGRPARRAAALARPGRDLPAHLLARHHHGAGVGVGCPRAAHRAGADPRRRARLDA